MVRSCGSKAAPDDAGATIQEGGETPTLARTMVEPTVGDELLAQLVHSLSDAVVIADPDGTIVFWNDAASRLFGWSIPEALGQTLDIIIPERLRHRHWAGYHEVMATGRTSYGERLLEVPALHREGRRLSIAFTVTLLCRPGDARPSAIAAVVRDDTERWQERRELKEEIDSLRAAADPRPASLASSHRHDASVTT
jgi:PAS domain S-box-containing protein